MDDLAARRQALLERLGRARTRLLLALRDLPPELREQPGSADDWTPKDLAGVAASREGHLLTQAQRLLNGEAARIQWIAGPEALAAWQARERSRQRDWSWQEVIRELALSREELDWNLAGAEPGALFAEHLTPVGTITPAALLEIIAAQDDQDAARLEGWSPREPERRFRERELRRYDGQRGRPAYIAHAGVVYDVTQAPNWRGGMHRNLHYPGLDLTRSLRKAPHDASVFARVPRVGILVEDE